MTMGKVTKGLFLAAILTALGGCNLWKERVPTTIIQTVDRLVKVPCLKPGQRPDQPSRLSEDDPVPPDQLTRMVGYLRAKLKEWQDDYGPTADDLLANCENLPTVP